MKKIITFFLTGAALAALGTTFPACNTPGKEGGSDEPEAVGILPISVSDLPEEVFAFFGQHLPPSNDSRPPIEFDFGDVDREDTVCLTIDSREDFEAIAPASVKLPSVDFEKYTIVIGQHPDGSGHSLTSQNVDTESDVMVLHLVYNWLEGGHHAMEITRYFWGLYPKLPPKPISVDVIVK